MRNAATKAAIVAAGGVEALVELVTNGEAGGQEEAARALANLAFDNAANRAAMAAAGAIPPLVAIVTTGAPRGQERAAYALKNLAHGNAANKVAIIAAGAVDPLIVMREQRDASERLKLYARVALYELDLAAIASRSQTLQAENESLAAENWRLRAHVEELDESYEHPRQLDLASQ